ncbi:MAG: SAM-dependent methyltransferase [Betaproteobacteria bacterium RBG_16_58_11]|nr:MAG: SAM-dependent methyltransferase [Betaproteobacteria bacterium RBG_16_58_11]OFZ96477.1 MAG: SAM-dependent methyltransferase [Betaproteobacteria bacterium RBG_19FT_COMBO_58_11]
MATHWDEVYAAPDYIFGKAPNAFLVSQQALLQPGYRALAVADGEGRNGVWLAEQGLDVLSVEYSLPAVEKARQLAQERGVALAFEVADVLTWSWPVNAYDIVAAIFIQFASPADRPKLFQHLQAALKPGGYLILQGYTPKQLEYKTGGPPSAENMYTPELLRAAFADMEIVHLAEHEEFIAEGSKHYGMSALIDMVARKR